MENEKLELVRKFLSRTDLVGTDLKLKQSTLKLDTDAVTARAELEKMTKSTNEKQMEVLSISQRLEALVQLILQVLASEPELVTPEAE